jgi:pyridoxal phosphate enzyme (YggS family)
VTRSAELRTNLRAVHQRIARACGQAGRAEDSVNLIVVTKFFPASDVRELVELGVRHVGENRHQEAVLKSAECADLPLTWHFIGGLQSNKAAAVAAYSHVVHTVDRAKLVGPLDRGAMEGDRKVDVLLQVSLDGLKPQAPGRSLRAGATPPELPGLAYLVESAPHLTLRGLMTVAPLEIDPRIAFGDLAKLAADFRQRYPSATWVSAGMSGDLEAAVAAGATHVRIGSAVLGPRPKIK